MRSISIFIFALTVLAFLPGLAGAQAARPSAVSLAVMVDYGLTLVVYSATVVATLKSEGKPAVGRSVSFEVVSGPHLGAPKVTSKTDSKGQARSTYLGDGNLGIDTVRVIPLESGSSRDPSGRLTTFIDCGVKWKPVDPCDPAVDDFFGCLIRYLAEAFAQGAVHCAAPAYGNVAQIALRTDPRAEYELLDLMRGVRDKILKRDAAGRHLVDLWSAHSAELVRLGIESPALLIEMHDFVQRNRGLLQDLMARGEGRIAVGDLESLRAVLDRFAVRGSPELREAVADVERTLADPQLLGRFGIRAE